MTERSVQLHVKTPTERQDMGWGQSSSQLPDTPEQGSQQRFAQAMKATELAPAVPLPGQTDAASLSHPMGLFGASTLAPTPAAHSALLPLLPLLRDSLRGLQVGQDGRRVRLEISEELYPGVSVSVFEDAGAWVAQFVCSQRPPYQELAACAPEMARKLADELGRDALWRVIDESQGPVAEGDAQHSTEAFASAPPN